MLGRKGIIRWLERRTKESEFRAGPEEVMWKVRIMLRSERDS